MADQFTYTPMPAVDYSMPGTTQQPWAKAMANWGYQPNIPDPSRMGDYSFASMPTPQLNAMATPAGSAPAGGFTDWLRSTGVIGTTDQKTGVRTDGWGGLALGAATGLGSLYLGMQQYNLAKETLANNKAQFERNFANQVKTTNTNLEDRQRARVASNAGAYQSVGDYMSQNGVK
jgi:hypothetical protein